MRDPNWIPYDGQGTPCKPESMVDIIMRNGETMRTQAAKVDWRHIDGQTDVVGYRFITDGSAFKEWPPANLFDSPAHDPVNHPKHYTNHPSGVECIQITEHMGFCLGNAVKYIWRADLKADAIEDLKKARWYIEREIEKRTK